MDGSVKFQVGSEEVEKKKEKVGSSSSGSSDSDTSSNSETGMEETPVKMGKKILPNTWDSGSLIKLKKRIDSLQDLEQMRDIVYIIEEAALYTITGSMFNFELGKLDDTTLTKVMKVIEHTC